MKLNLTHTTGAGGVAVSATVEKTSVRIRLSLTTLGLHTTPEWGRYHQTFRRLLSKQQNRNKAKRNR